MGGERRQSLWILAALTVAAGLLGSAAIGTGLTKQDAAPADPIRDNNRGVALMEQFRHGARVDSRPPRGPSAAGAEHFTLFAKIDNLFDEDYETFGLFGEADEVLGDEFDDPRFLSPASPRSGWIGVRLTR